MGQRGVAWIAPSQLSSPPLAPADVGGLQLDTRFFAVHLSLHRGRCLGRFGVYPQLRQGWLLPLAPAPHAGPVTSRRHGHVELSADLCARAGGCSSTGGRGAGQDRVGWGKEGMGTARQTTASWGGAVGVRVPLSVTIGIRKGRTELAGSVPFFAIDRRSAMQASVLRNSPVGPTVSP